MNKIYEKIIQDSDIGYAYYRIIFDSKDRPCDYQCIETNKSFEEYTRLYNVDILELYKRISKNDEGEENEKYLENTNRWCRIKTYSPKKNYIVISCKDIAEIKKLEEVEKSSIQIINSFPSGVFWKNKDFKYMGCNKEFTEISGYSAKEIIGKDDYEIKWEKNQ